MGILIVDDDNLNLELLSTLLTKAGYDELIKASSAEEAYSILGLHDASNNNHIDIDLIIMDVIMPGIDGLQACREIKGDERLNSIPIIIVTADRSSDILKSTFESGASDYVSKPINSVELLARISSVMTLKQEIDARRDKEERLLKITVELTESNEMLRIYEKALEDMQMGVTITDPGGKIIYANPAEAEMHQYSREELVGQDVRIFAPKKLWKPMKKEELKNISSFKRETVNLRKDGSEFPAQLLSDVVWNGRGEPMAIVTTSEDITERKRTEEALRSAHDDMEKRVKERTSELTLANSSLKKEIDERIRIEDVLRQSENEFRSLFQQFNTLLNAIPDSLILFSHDLSIIWSNEGALHVFDIIKKDIKGCLCRNVRDAFADSKNSPVEKCFKSGREENEELMTRKGKRLHARAFPIFGEGGRVINVLELTTDETEKMHLQAEAMRAGHLASLGELSAGIAHEINNPINGIIICAELILSKEGEDKKLNELSEMIINEGKRVARIVHALLAFARKRGERKSAVDLHQIFLDSLALTEAHLRKDAIELVVDFPERLPPILGNDQQIQQVFLNMINNARYALNCKYGPYQKDKVLEVRAKEKSLGKKEFVSVTFLDKGTGIAGDVLDKVMDPFFSTKPANEGTGLGLSISHGIISDHGGTIDIESKEGEYTKITVNLPVLEG